VPSLSFAAEPHRTTAQGCFGLGPERETNLSIALTMPGCGNIVAAHFSNQSPASARKKAEIKDLDGALRTIDCVGRMRTIGHGGASMTA
jgi:hypothetical protein